MKMTLNDWGKVLVSIVVVTGFLAVTVLYLTTKLQGGGTPEILSILLGTLAAAFQQVISYWVGSSAGSAMKDQALAQAASKT